jgi:hypothetical protein
MLAARHTCNHTHAPVTRSLRPRDRNRGMRAERLPPGRSQSSPNEAENNLKKYLILFLECVSLLVESFSRPANSAGFLFWDPGWPGGRDPNLGEQLVSSRVFTLATEPPSSPKTRKKRVWQARFSRRDFQVSLMESLAYRKMTYFLGGGWPLRPKIINFAISNSTDFRVAGPILASRSALWAGCLPNAACAAP